MRLVAGKIAIAVVVMLIGSGLVVYIRNRPADIARPAALGTAPPPPIAHSAAWYVAHPDVLRKDEQRCAGDAATILRAACQNIASADAQLNVIEMRNAAAANADTTPPVGAGSKSK
jgi:hypothetical protein